MNSGKKLPIGVQSFQNIRLDQYIYVDKTEYIFQLKESGSQFFLSRPRRFGKSLLLSTMRAYWEGKKELFSGLSIERLEEGKPEAWKSYPVFYFDFNRDSYQSAGALEGILDAHLKEWETVYGCTDREASLAVRFQHLLVRAQKQSGLRCVVLVDEYDKSLLEAMENAELEEHNKAVFKGFFSALKSYDAYLQFVFITGVTKFSKISIFSDLNQLNDISFSKQYAGMCGITEAELKSSFSEEITRLAEEYELSSAVCLQKLRSTYDGYRFNVGGPSVYNPFSLLNAFYHLKFGYYWFGSGTPTFLVRRLREIDFDIRRFTTQELFATEGELSDCRGDNPDPVPLLYQTGYLTLKEYDEDADYYSLGYPNDEVKYGFLESLMPEYTGNTGTRSGTDIFTLKRKIENADLDGIRDILMALFAGIPYPSHSVPFEHDFQSVIYLVFTLLGKQIKCELHSARGRADCVAETEKYVFLFEFKLDDSAETALKQIQEKGYAIPYIADQRRVFKIGVGFDSEMRTLTDWKVEE